MSATKFLSAALPNAVSTAPATVATMAMTPAPAPTAQATSPPSACLETVAFSQWQRVIDYKLIHWGCCPSELEDEGLQPPSPEVIGRAIRFAKEVQQRDYPAPTSVYPDPNGGIVFERRRKDTSEKYHFWDDGTVEYLRFESAKLVERRPLE